MKNIKTLNITVEFKSRNLIGMLKILKNYKIDATDFKKVSIISKTLEIRNHNVKIEAGVRTAFDGKEMIVIPKKSLKISHFFKSFPSWLRDNHEKLIKGELIDAQEILQVAEKSQDEITKQKIVEEIIHEKRYRSSVEKQMSKALFKDSKMFREQQRVSNMIQQKHAPIKVNLQKRVERAHSQSSNGELEYNSHARSNSMTKMNQLENLNPSKQAPRNKDDSSAPTTSNLMVAHLNFTDGWSESGGEFAGNESIGDMDLNLSIDRDILEKN